MTMVDGGREGCRITVHDGDGIDAGFSRASCVMRLPRRDLCPSGPARISFWNSIHLASWRGQVFDL